MRANGALTSGAAELFLQPACCLQAVLGVVESEVVGRDSLRVSLWPLTLDFTGICSRGSHGLEKGASEWIYGTDLGGVQTQRHSHCGYPRAAVLAHPSPLSHSANTPAATGNMDPQQPECTRVGWGERFKQHCQHEWRHLANSSYCPANSRNVTTHSTASQQLSEEQITLRGPWKVFVKPNCLHLLSAKINLLQRKILSQRKGSKPAWWSFKCEDSVTRWLCNAALQ